MMFSVMHKWRMDNGKDAYDVIRLHDSVLSENLRKMQDAGCYIVAVIPLFKKREVKDEVKDKVKDKVNVVSGTSSGMLMN